MIVCAHGWLAFDCEGIASSGFDALLMCMPVHALHIVADSECCCCLPCSDYAGRPCGSQQHEPNPSISPLSCLIDHDSCCCCPAVNVLADHVAANNMSARHISELRRDLVPDPDIALLAQLSTAAGITLRCANPHPAPLCVSACLCTPVHIPMSETATQNTKQHLTRWL